MKIPQALKWHKWIINFRGFKTMAHKPEAGFEEH
jgi:hypothetical protein